MSYVVTLEDDKTGDLHREVVDVEKRKDAVKSVNSKFGKDHVVVDISTNNDDDTIKYEHEDDSYEVLIGDTNDK